RLAYDSSALHELWTPVLSTKQHSPLSICCSAFCFRESLIGRHESLEHRRNHLGWIGRLGLARALGEELGIGNKIAMERRRELYRDLDGLVVGIGPSFSLVMDYLL